MAKYELGSTVSDKIRKKMMQYEAVTGRTVPPDVIRAMMEAEVGAMAQGARAERAIDVQQGYLDLAEEAQKKQSQAATIGGIGELAVGGTQMYRNLFPKAVTSPTSVAGALPVSSGLPSVGTLTAGGGATTGAGMTLGTSAAPGYSLTAPATYGGAFGVGGAPALTGVAPLATDASLMGTAGGTASVIGGTPALTAMGALGTAGAGIAGGLLGGWLGEQKAVQAITPWGGEKTEKKLGGTLGGAVAGAAVGGPIGGVIGAIAGFASSLFDW